MNIKTLRTNFRHNGVVVEEAADKLAALTRLQQLVPKGASVMHGSSLTLEQIGFLDYLVNGNHGWDYRRAAITAENDADKRLQLRREAALADYFLGSVHAIAETGELVWTSQSGSQLPGYAYSAPNVIWVASTKKIVADLPAALRFVDEVSLQRHAERWPKSEIYKGKTLVFHREDPETKRTLRLILVDEPLGYVP